MVYSTCIYKCTHIYTYTAVGEPPSKRCRSNDGRRSSTSNDPNFVGTGFGSSDSAEPSGMNAPITSARGTSGKEDMPGTSTLGRGGKEDMPGTSTRGTGGKEDMPGTSTRGTGGKEDMPGTSTRGTGGKEDMPGTSTRGTGGKEDMPGTSTLGRGGKEDMPGTSTRGTGWNVPIRNERLGVSPGSTLGQSEVEALGASYPFQQLQLIDPNPCVPSWNSPDLNTHASVLGTPRFPWQFPSSLPDWGREQDDGSDLGSTYSRSWSNLEPSTMVQVYVYIGILYRVLLLLVSPQAATVFGLLYCVFICYLQSLRNMVVNMNSQTQTMLSSMNTTLQHLGSEMTALKDIVLRKSSLKRRKVPM